MMTIIAIMIMDGITAPTMAPVAPELLSLLPSVEAETVTVLPKVLETAEVYKSLEAVEILKLLETAGVLETNEVLKVLEIPKGLVKLDTVEVLATVMISLTVEVL